MCYINNNKGAKMFKMIINTIATLLVFVGIVMMAGSAGDCDGRCVENANTISEMLMYAGIGLTNVGRSVLSCIDTDFDG